MAPSSAKKQGQSSPSSPLASFFPSPLDSALASPLVYIITILVAVLIGIGIGIFADKYLPASMSNTQKGYQSGFAAAKAIVDNSTFGKYLKVQSNSRALSGTVTKVTGTTITMRTVTEDPFIDPSMRDRTVLLNGSTSLTLITTKNNPKPTSKVTAPIFERETITATDIRIGDSIGIFLTAETIKATQPTALTVQVLPRATTTRK